MLKDKKGLSAIVMTIIMIGLVLVAVGIVWVVVLNILEGQSEELTYDQQCLGLSFDVKGLDCASGSPGTCSFIVERNIGSEGGSIDGIAVTLSNSVMNTDEFYEDSYPQLEGNIAASKTISEIAHDFGLSAGDPDSVSVRVYFLDEEENKHFCNRIFSS